MSSVENVVVVDSNIKKPRGRKAVPKDSTAVDVQKDAVKAPKAKKGTETIDVVKVPKVKKAIAPKATECEDGEITDEKKPRKPSLPAKYGKFIQFGMFLMKELNDEKVLAGEAPVVDEGFMLERLQVFAEVDAQKDFVQKFFDGAKDIAKNMRKMIADKKKADAKANKPVKARKPRAETKGLKNDLKNDLKNGGDLVDELVSLANNDANDKPKRKYNRKPKNVSADTDPAQLDAAPELEVDVILLDGKQFLLDDQRRLFDFTSHHLIGHLSLDNLFIPL
jgi:hypothetical protein